MFVVTMKLESPISSVGLTVVLTIKTEMISIFNGSNTVT